MTVFLVLMAVVVAAVWWWISQIKISAEPIAMMATRIAFPGGVRLSDPERALRFLERPEEIVIPFASATLVIDYPLTTPASVPISSALLQGFTRGELVKIICEEYSNVYEAEEGTAHTKTVPLAERGEARSRNRTDGLYGIWGHDLEDLELNALRWTRKSDGSVVIELNVST